MKYLREKYLTRFTQSASKYLTEVYSQPTQRKNLVDFTSGIIVLMIGNLFSVWLFYSLSKMFFATISIVCMSLLGALAISARRKKEVTTWHYFFAFVVTYGYGLRLFWFSDNTKGIFMFGLVYPVLAIYILKSLWGNLLIALQLISSLLLNAFVNPHKIERCSRSIYICIYIMFWIFSITMEETRNFMERRLREQQERLAFYANYDPLTKLFNRRHFFERVKVIFPEGEHARPAALLIMDLDNFKSVNDTYGHNIGDIVLSETAKRVKDSTRSTDICCRWGGEEFLVMAQIEKEACGVQFAQKICDAIGGSPYTLPDGKELNVTVSIGLVFTQDIHDIGMPSLIRYADENLYKAKKAGKNRVCSSICRYNVLD